MYPTLFDVVEHLVGGGEGDFFDEKFAVVFVLVFVVAVA